MSIKTENEVESYNSQNGNDVRSTLEKKFVHSHYYTLKAL